MSLFTQFIDCFKDGFFNYTFSVSSKDSNIDPNTGLVSNSFSQQVKNIQCAYWEGSSAQKYIGERLRPDLDGSIVCNFKDLGGYTIQDSDVVSLSDGQEFTVIHGDNMMGFGDVYLIQVKRKENG